MPTVDILDIQISTSLKNTDKMLDNLIKKLGTVSSSLSRVGGTTSNVSNGMTRVATSATRSTKSFNGLAAAFGRFYANYFLVVRGIKALYKSIEGTADYIEAFNYFEVSFNKIASEWKQDYKKFGYDNAEAYAESFNKRAKESLSKLSGVQIDIDADGKGLLTETGMKNLGLNIQEITQYASQLASVTNSVGQTGEVSLAAANSFTKLAGDISSLFNQDYSAVAKNLQSGLIGQSRALYKYGIDITNATLQTYAFKLGLEKEVAEMTQAEKMQLRMIAILDQSKVSWGDLANTIDSPSNMIRQFKNNLKEAGMVLGQLFVPLLSKVLPVINGVTIAIKRLLVNIAGFLGIELDLSSFGQGGVEIEDTFDDVSDSLDNVADSAKKAKAGLRGFDELKQINMTNASGGGTSGGIGGSIDLTDEILKTTSEYEKVWDDAYKQMENRAQAFADSISKYLKPIEKLFKDISIGDWFAVGEDVSNIVSGIFNFFSKAISSVDWYQLGQNIGAFLEGLDWTKILGSVGNFIWTAINAAIELWKGSFDAAPIETWIITSIALLSWTGLGSALVKSLGSVLLEKLPLLGTALATGLSSAFTLAIGGIILGIPTYFVGIYDAIKDGIDWLSGVLIPAGATAAGAGIGAIIGMLGGPIGAGIGALIGLAVGLVTDGVILIVEKWDSIKKWFYGIGKWFGTHVVEPIKKVWTPIATWFDDNIVEPIGNFFEGFSKRVSQIFEGLKIIVQAIWITVSGWFNEKVIKPIVGFFAPIVENISNFFKSAWNKVKDIWKGVSTWFKKNIGEPLGKVWEKVTTKIKNLFSSLWSGIKSGIVNTMNAVIGGIEKGINFIISGINKIISGFNKIVSWAAKVAEVNWDGVDLVPKVALNRIQAYEVGGFPDKASLFWANENGIPELVGTMGGKTAVASGMEITGIKDAIYSTGQQETNLMNTMVGLLRIIAEKEYGITDSDIGKSAQRYARDYFNRTGNEAYSF